jgi:hypothetical protein
VKTATGQQGGKFSLLSDTFAQLFAFEVDEMDGNSDIQCSSRQQSDVSPLSPGWPLLVTPLLHLCRRIDPLQQIPDAFIIESAGRLSI